MKLQDAVEQYVDMLTLGSQALQRLAKAEAEPPLLLELDKIILSIVQQANQLKAILYQDPSFGSRK